MTTPYCKWNHAIVLMMDASKPLKCKTYPLTLKEQNAIDEILLCSLPPLTQKDWRLLDRDRGLEAHG